VIGVRSPAGARRGRGQLAGRRCHSHSERWHAQNVTKQSGGATGEAQWRIGTRTTGRKIAPPPRRTPLDNQSTSRADGSAKWQAVAWCLEPWCTHRNAGWERDRACSRRPDSLWEIHRPTIGLSGTIGRHLSDLSCFLQRQTEAATFALPGQSSDTTRVISAWWQQHLPSLPPTTYICHFCAFGMQATAVVKKTRSTDSKRDR